MFQHNQFQPGVQFKTAYFDNMIFTVYEKTLIRSKGLYMGDECIWAEGSDLQLYIFNIDEITEIV